jgi:serine-type D-Ala-D-Ala carboxypeptidase/endopeptidase (penicillin-binding protein 4)
VVTHAVVKRPPPPSPAALRLRAALLKVFSQAGPNTGGIVTDMQSHLTVFALRDRVKRPPASVEKLYTSVAVLQAFGPDAQLHTTLLGTGHLAADGTWVGDLYLKGGGDPTFGDGSFNRTWELGYGPTAAQLVGQLRAHGIRRVSGAVIGDDSLFDGRRGPPSSGFAPDIPDLGGQLAGLTYDHGSTMGPLSPGAFAARELVLTMNGAHIEATAASFTRRTPGHAHRLASVRSPHMATLIRLMDVPSDDFFAEMLTKRLGVHVSQDGSTAAGAKAIAGEIASDYDLHPAIVDGSGLSRADHSSPLEVVELLDKLWHTSTGQTLAASLPLMGIDGTVRRIAVGTPAQGHCVAKTGTLDYVTNLAGYCHIPGHPMVSFALFLDGPTNERSIVLLSRMMGAIARY